MKSPPAPISGKIEECITASHVSGGDAQWVGAASQRAM